MKGAYKMDTLDDKKIKDTIAERIRELRLAKGLSKKALVNIVNDNDKTNTLDKWENGTNTPNPCTLSRIADALGCDIDYLIGKQDIPSRVRTDIKAETGLSDIVIELLQYYNQKADYTITALNWLIENGLISDVCSAMSSERVKCLSYNKIQLPKDIDDFARRSRNRCNIQPEDNPEDSGERYLKALVEDISELNLKTVKKWERLDWVSLLKPLFDLNNTAKEKVGLVEENVNKFIDLYFDKANKDKNAKRYAELGVKIFILTNANFLILEKVDMDHYLIIPHRFNSLIDTYTDELLESR